MSRSGAIIRLTAERWTHVVEAHDYMAGLHEWVLEAVADPDAICEGWDDSLIALQHRAKTPITSKDLVVVYCEVASLQGTEHSDGFVITAFMTSKPERIRERGILWARKH